MKTLCLFSYTICFVSTKKEKIDTSKMVNKSNKQIFNGFVSQRIIITLTSTNLTVYLEELGYNKWCHLVEFTALLTCNPQLSPGHLIFP